MLTRNAIYCDIFSFDTEQKRKMKNTKSMFLSGWQTTILLSTIEIVLLSTICTGNHSSPIHPPNRVLQVEFYCSDPVTEKG